MKHVMTTECWKAVPGYEGRYEVSDLGNVRSLNHMCPHRAGSRKVPGKVLSPGPQASGHLSVSIGKGNSKLVHALVLAAFVGPRPGNMDVLHLNHVPTDNRLCNLKYGTRSENLKMDYAAGTRHAPSPSGSSHGLTKLNSYAVRVIRSSSLSLAELGRIFGVCYQTIGAVRSGKTWGHIA